MKVITVCTHYYTNSQGLISFKILLGPLSIWIQKICLKFEIKIAFGNINCYHHCIIYTSNWSATGNAKYNLSLMQSVQRPILSLVS